MPRNGEAAVHGQFFIFKKIRKGSPEIVSVKRKRSVLQIKECVHLSVPVLTQEAAVVYFDPAAEIPEIASYKAAEVSCGLVVIAQYSL